ncbi:hypothetical protein QYE76_046033 [Lolium multiflorum]|uniref:Small ribosomal subunit protein uS15c n=1 Tax=Lolium multiflorum TaxID=4521 RepID=A0AAD8WYA9_LOLMU|nr:hypothetical protein QYE76_046033 [Lolium multiflorum]
MALRRINPTKKPLLHLPRPFSSNSPFPPPPPPQSDDPDASPRSPPPNSGEPPQRPSLFSDLRERLRSSPAPPPPRRIPTNPPRPTGQAAAPLDDIRRSLESFRAASRNPGGASTPTPPLFSSGGGTPSFQDLLRSSGPPAARNPNADGAKPFAFDFTTLREGLRKIDPRQQQPKEFLSATSAAGIFAKERAGTEAEDADAAVMLYNTYTYETLGKELQELRPPGAGKDGKEWFSLQELQGRIAKLAAKDKDARFGGQFHALKQSMRNIEKTDKQKAIRNMGGMFSIANLTGNPIPEYLSQPPQEELLQRYFHPDHMSGEEKMKLELQKVRDEFKMSENDCGSARVQIAQLTLKIKHLSSVLHKKDKHSRKGLQDMVQRRKKYLKYLRRTDWDSYCMVLSKLGLRDIPEYKAPDYKKTQPTKAQSKKSKSKRKRKMKA